MVFEVLPLVPLMVMVWLPVLACVFAVRLRVDDPLPGSAIEVGLKLAVTPVGRPLADKEIAPLKPFSAAVVTFVVPAAPPAVTDTVVGEALILKVGAGAAVTVRETVVLLTRLPLVPVMVMV